MRKRKIINDPLYGFIRISEEIIFDLISHPTFQRLRRIKQLGLTHLVYPGALHTRFHHALGAMHLMKKALDTLVSKGVEVSQEEREGALVAILLHDIGHGPFSHSLEHELIEGSNHESISRAIMHQLNEEFNGRLTVGIEIFNGEYHKHFLHQLVSSQLDVDRLDYLRRDSFYTGVSEGVVGLDRIIEMLTVDNGDLVIESKGIYSVEKFIIARRMMYWQVYLHKTSIVVDHVLMAILRRARQLVLENNQLFAPTSLHYFLGRTEAVALKDKHFLSHFNNLDDTDFECAMKEWRNHPDFVLSTLCKMLIDRKLPKIVLRKDPIGETDIAEAKAALQDQFPELTEEERSFFRYTGEVKNEAYEAESKSIEVLDKNGNRTELTQATDNYNLNALEETVTKYFISYPK